MRCPLTDYVPPDRDVVEEPVRKPIRLARAAWHATGWAKAFDSDDEQPASQPVNSMASEATQKLQAYQLLQDGARKRPRVAAESDLDTTAPAGMKQGTDLAPYQAQHYQDAAQAYMAGQPGMAFTQEMGLGKTRAALATATAVEKIPGSPHLIVVPLSVLSHWCDEFEKWMEPSVRLCVYHDNPDKGSHTSHSIKDMSKYDFVLTTYDKVLQEHNALSQRMQAFEAKHRAPAHHRNPNRGNGILPLLQWNILILDESHRIANGDTQTFIAINSLNVRFRLPMTGTPLQNEFSDIQSLCKFLKIKPWEDKDLFKQHFLIMNSDTNAAKALLPDVNAILALSVQAFVIRLRRSDSFDGHEAATFKAGSQFMVWHDLTSEEEQSQQLTITIWDEEERRRRREQGVGSIFEKGMVFKALMTARQALIHELVTDYPYGELGDTDLIIAPGDSGRGIDQLQTVIKDETTVLRGRAADNRRTLRMLTKKAWVTSSKMVRFANLVKNHMAQYKGKLIVISEWLSALDIGENVINDIFDGQLKVTRYDGTVDEATRAQHVRDFQESEDLGIIMMTARAGSLGIELTRANAVIFLTSGWNPHMAAQGAHRAIRIGQEKTVRVYTLYAHNSIERRVMLKQRIKSAKSSKLVDPDESMRRRMREVATWSLDEFSRKMDELQSASIAHKEDLSQYAASSAIAGSLVDILGDEEDELDEYLTELLKESSGLNFMTEESDYTVGTELV